MTSRRGSGQLRCAGARPGRVRAGAARQGRRARPENRCRRGGKATTDVLDLWITGTHTQRECLRAPLGLGRGRPTGAGCLLEMQ